MSRSNPFDEVERMLDRMSRQFEGFDPAEFGMTPGGMAVDVVDEGDRLVVTADLPGYDPDDIDVTLRDETTLHISADHETDVETEGETDDGVYVRRERRHQSISRSVSLPERVDEAETGASYDNGVLTVTLPKLAADDDSGQHIPVN